MAGAAYQARQTQGARFHAIAIRPRFLGERRRSIVGSSVAEHSCADGEGPQPAGAKRSSVYREDGQIHIDGWFSWDATTYAKCHVCGLGGASAVGDSGEGLFSFDSDSDDDERLEVEHDYMLQCPFCDLSRHRSCSRRICRSVGGVIINVNYD